MAIRFFVISTCILCLSFHQVAGLTLQFQYLVDDGTNQTAADDFYAISQPGVPASDTLDSADLRKQPPLPGSGTRIQSWADTINLIGDFRYLDTEWPRRSWPIQLSVVNGQLPGVLVHTLKLLDSGGLEDLPQGTMVYLRRYDAGGAFVDYYDLTLPENHTIIWHTEFPDDPSGSIDLVVVHGCLAANLDALGTIDLKDFAILAKHWMQDDVYGTADIDGNDTADLSDVVIMAKHWLLECPL